MKATVYKSDFVQAFHNCGRGNQFSTEALETIYEWFEELDDSCGTETELDVIAICCDFSEDNWESIADNYSIDTADCEDNDEAEQAVEEYLIYNTSLVGKTSTGFVYQAF